MIDDSYSNYGPEIDVAAPCTSIYSTANGGGFVNMTGTSMASPNAAGVAALIKSSHPEYSAGQVREALRKTAVPTAYLGKDRYCGFGAVNAYAASLGFEGTFEVCYDFNDGERLPLVRNVVPWSILIEPSSPHRYGYFFECWSLSADDEGEFIFKEKIEGDTTLYAYECVKLGPTNALS